MTTSDNLGSVTGSARPFRLSIIGVAFAELDWGDTAALITVLQDVLATPTGDLCICGHGRVGHPLRVLNVGRVNCRYCPCDLYRRSFPPTEIGAGS